MQIDKIITLGNSKVRLRVLALERSLRKVGCHLPLWVIPYDDDRFDLPANCLWWEVPEITGWLKKNNAHPMMRKYQCLTIGNYQFADSDVVFLVNPEKTLASVNGFITSCGHWQDASHTYTAQSLKFLKSKSTLWQKMVFNAGQFACDKPLYSMESLMAKAESQAFKYTCLTFPYHDQPGLNLLVNASDVSIQNLTLPPFNMESTWAGDYPEKDFSIKWNDQNKPYLIHWAGFSMQTGKPIDELFYNYLSGEEKTAWNHEVNLRMEKERKAKGFIKVLFRKLKAIYSIIKE
jgi:hypothetical protein